MSRPKAVLSHIISKSQPNSDNVDETTRLGQPRPSPTVFVSAPTCFTNKATSPSSGLSASQKTYLGVGVTLGVLRLAVVVGMFILVRRKRAARHTSRRKSFGGLPGDTVYEAELHGDGTAMELQGGDVVSDAPRHQRENRPQVQVPPPTYGNVKLPLTSSPREVIRLLSTAEPPPYSPQERGSTPAVTQGPMFTAVDGDISSRSGAGRRLDDTSSNEASRLREEDRLAELEKQSR